ncbi:MAG: FHA domain-containing protein [Planctomycetes bacterium]|nr:FHA domain-containing protein [Planctomycetota bacterium]
MPADLDAVSELLERFLVESRVRDVERMMREGSAQRLARIRAVLQQMPQQAYLVGTGPYTVGIHPLSVDEIVIGRSPSPLEERTDRVIDISVNDCITLTPREVSRVHAKILRRKEEGAFAYVLVDQKSRLGTYVNGKALTPPDSLGDPGEEAQLGQRLESGDVISLGPSLVNTFVFLRPEERPAPD